MTDGSIESLVLSEDRRRELFPVCRDKAFFAHAGVTALPKPVADAVIEYTRKSSENHQEFGEVLRDIDATRALSARFIGARPEEIALLGPTSLGLSLVANGLPWKAGEEVVCYLNDYPANVYPWLDLRRHGVSIRLLEPERPGEITPELVAAALTPRTRLVALASCNFLTGYRIDVDAIGALLAERGVLFCLDGIQTLGAFPLSVKHVDFLSADAHKWMLGPMAIGIVFVKKERFAELRPSLLGAWNIQSPNFITQPEIVFHETARRYEPGVLNIAGVYGMRAALELILAAGPENIAARIVDLQTCLIEKLQALGFEIVSPKGGPNASGIVTFRHPRARMAQLFRALEENRVIASLRFDREGVEYIRMSPHFYNTHAEIDGAISILKPHI